MRSMVQQVSSFGWDLMLTVGIGLYKSLACLSLTRRTLARTFSRTHTHTHTHHTHTHTYTHTHMFGSLTRSRPVRFGSTLRNSMLIEKVLQRYPKAITMASQHANRIKISPSPSAPSLAKPRLPKEMESFQLFHLARSSLPKARSNSQSLLSWSQRL